MRDFTLRLLQELYLAIRSNGYQILRFEDYLLQNNTRGKYIILRHDVDADPQQALRVARIEKELNIRSSYYFRNKKSSFDRDVICNIADLGHEIGYHYEDLARYRGDLTKAYESFNSFLEELRTIYPVKTICMHGSPLSKYNNLDLWKTFDYRAAGVLGDIYLDTPFNRHWYLTDTGRGWNSKFSVRDRVENSYHIQINNTNTLIDYFNSRKLPPRIMINIHPQRWSQNFSGWTYELISQSLKNVLKQIYINNFMTSGTR